MCGGKGVGGTARQCRGAPSKKGTACQSIVGGTARPVHDSALGKEGRKYGVGMGKNCPFMRETTALKPTMDGVGMGENCPFMRGKRLLYSIDLLGGGAGKWGKNAPTLSIRPHVFQKRKK